MLTGLKIRIDAANAQLVQLGLLTEYLYTQLEAQGISIDMNSYPTWAENRYKEIQEQAQNAVKASSEEIEQIKASLKENIQKSPEEAIADIASPESEE